uniref:Actin-related protein 2/3 complex subunit 1B n=1 Tax=Arundo donax TaxID=35708 RepID=A0A0A9F0D6_ARUDO
MVRLWYGIWKIMSTLQNSSKEGLISIKLNEHTGQLAAGPAGFQDPGPARSIAYFVVPVHKPFLYFLA